MSKINRKVPENVKIHISDEIHPMRSLIHLANIIFSVFPTRGENFGHVIPEALSAGTPILLSDQTHWEQDASLGLQILPLKSGAWINAIEEWSKLTDEEL